MNCLERNIQNFNHGSYDWWHHFSQPNPPNILIQNPLVSNPETSSPKEAISILKCHFLSIEKIKLFDSWNHFVVLFEWWNTLRYCKLVCSLSYPALSLRWRRWLLLCYFLFDLLMALLFKHRAYSLSVQSSGAKNATNRKNYFWYRIQSNREDGKRTSE